MWNEFVPIVAFSKERIFRITFSVLSASASSIMVKGTFCVPLKFAGMTIVSSDKVKSTPSVASV
ncbi:hypothetical protein D3C86_1459420 [compost metagenome]